MRNGNPCDLMLAAFENLMTSSFVWSIHGSKEEISISVDFNFLLVWYVKSLS